MSDYGFEGMLYHAEDAGVRPYGTTGAEDSTFLLDEHPAEIPDVESLVGFLDAHEKASQSEPCACKHVRIHGCVYVLCCVGDM